MIISLAACGGGGSGGTTVASGTAGGSSNTPPASNNNPGSGANPDAAQPGSSPAISTQFGTMVPSASAQPAAGPAPLAFSAPMTMACAEGASHQCSGNSVYRIDNGISLTRSGVQTIAGSSSDLMQPNPQATTAFGMLQGTGGIADVRLARDTNSGVSAAMLLDHLDLTWDGKTPRPPIFETFRAGQQGRIRINGDGTLSAVTLPAPSDLSFYDYATKGFSATQAHYANNIYFPRAGASRCAPDLNPCPTTETSGFQRSEGNWRAGGREPDALGAVRLHEDGDIHAGNGIPGSDGSATTLPGGNGVGVPFPGAKGYRSLFNWGYRYANLTTWLTQDTVVIEEWAAMGDEHNKNRRGAVAFGEVTPPSAIPASGSATYTGIVYGWHTPVYTQEPSAFRGNATITVDFASRRVTLSFTDTRTYDSAYAPVPAAFSATISAGAANTSVANYFTGAINNNELQGGLSGRYFGPAAAGSASVIPEEVGGVFSLSGTANGAVVVGGFIGRRE